jgi:hypothetical protein
VVKIGMDAPSALGSYASDRTWERNRPGVSGPDRTAGEAIKYQSLAVVFA